MSCRTDWRRTEWPYSTVKPSTTKTSSPDGRGDAGALGHGRRERFRRGRLRQAREGLRPHLRPDAPSRPAAGHPAHGHPAGRARARGRRRHRHQPVALSARLRRSPASTSRRRCSRRRASARRGRTCRARPPAADGRRRPQVRRRLVRHRLRAVSDQRRPRPGQGRAGDAPRLPAGRPDHLPQPFPQPEPDPLAHRAADFAAHHSHRLQVGSRPARVPRAGGPAADVDREGELPADLVAGDQRQSATDAGPAIIAATTSAPSIARLLRRRRRADQLASSPRSSCRCERARIRGTGSAGTAASRGP